MINHSQHSPKHIKQQSEWDCLFTCLMMFGIPKQQILKTCQKAVMEAFLPGKSLEVLDQMPLGTCIPGLIRTPKPALVFIRTVKGAEIKRHVIVTDGDMVLDPYLDFTLMAWEWCGMMDMSYDSYYTEAIVDWKDNVNHDNGEGKES